MDIIWLEVFREVARRGSFTAAAQALRYTQSAVSRQISALEADTGAVLFDRVPRGVRLTDEGRCLLDHAEAVLGRLDTARRDLAALRDLDLGRLRIGAFATADAALVPRAMATFRAAHPNVVRPEVQYVVPGWTAKLGLVAAGLGVTLVPGLAAGTARSDVLVKRLHPDDTAARGVYAATPNGPGGPPAVREFLGVLAATVARLRAEVRDVTSLH